MRIAGEQQRMDKQQNKDNQRLTKAQADRAGNVVANVFGSLAPDCLALLLCGFTLYSRLKANEVFSWESMLYKDILK